MKNQSEPLSPPWGPAIELADVHPPPEELEVILAGNIFHRRLVLGPPDRSRAGGRLEGLTARLSIDGAEEVVSTDLEAFSGNLVKVLGHMATTRPHGDDGCCRRSSAGGG